MEMESSEQNIAGVASLAQTKRNNQGGHWMAVLGDYIGIFVLLPRASVLPPRLQVRVVY
jgi:hypothetical protein